MARNIDRKSALKAYKERKIRPGIYAVREIKTGRAWAGSTQDLDTRENGLWHMLKEGRHLDKSLQTEWNRLGEARFEYVILEVIKEDMSPFVLNETLRSKKTEWERILATTTLESA